MNRRIADDLKTLHQESGTPSLSLRFEDLTGGRLNQLETFLGVDLPTLRREPMNVGRIRAAGSFPGYSSWHPTQKDAFDRICGPVMAALGR